MAKEKPIKVYGTDFELQAIRTYSTKCHLSVSSFLRKLALTEMNRHTKSGPFQALIKELIKEEVKRYIDNESHGILNREQINKILSEDK